MRRRTIFAPLRRIRVTPVRLGLFLLVAAALVTRLWQLDVPAAWEDDFLFLDRAELPVFRMLGIQKYQGPADTIFDFQPPLPYVLGHLVLEIDSSTLAARIPSVIAGVLTVIGLGLLGARLFSAPAGLACAALVTFLLFPINFSQAMKHYAVFLCLAVFSMWFLVRAVSENTRKLWLAYAACALGMLYSGYQGLPTFAIQMIWACLMCQWLAQTENARDSLRRWSRFLLACGGVFVAYLPWLPAVFFLNDFMHEASVNPWAGLDAAFASKILRGFIGPTPDFSTWFVLLWCAMAAFGCWTALARRRFAALSLVLAWAGASALALVVSRTFFRTILDSRHFIMVLPPLLLLAGLGVARLGEWGTGLFSRWPRAGRLAGPVLAGGAILGLLWPSLTAYPGYYGRIMSTDREFFQWLAGGRGDVAALEFHGYKRNTRRLALAWYLPGRFEEAGTFDAPGYRRLFDVDTFYPSEEAGRPSLPGIPVTAFASMGSTTRVTVAGLANRSPLVMDPGPDGVYRYADDFRSRRFYEDCRASESMTVDQELGLLRPAHYSRPARATWTFEIPAGLRARAIHLDVAAALYKKHSSIPADSLLTVEVGDGDGHFSPIGVIGQERFPVRDGRPVDEARPFFEELAFYHGRCREVVAGFDLDPALARNGSFSVRIGYRPGAVEGFLNISGIRLTADLEPTAAGQPVTSPLALAAGHLLRNVDARPWSAAEAETAGGLYAFALPGFGTQFPDLPVGSPEDATRFLAGHPGLDPVYSLHDATGRPALSLYDPGLPEPGIRLSSASPTRRVYGLPASGATPASLSIVGTIIAPTLRLGDRTLALGVAAPRGSRLTLTPGGRGRIRFVPDWTDKEHWREAMSYAGNVEESRRLRGELICRGEGGCAFAYTFISAFPVTELRIKAFPQVYGNPCRKCPANEARVRLSTDGGKTYRPLVESRGEECRWTPPGESVFRRVDFDPPVSSLILSFELGQGDQAGFLSPSWNVDGMYIEADVDASRLPPLSLPGPGATVSLVDPGQNDLTLDLRPSPWPLSGRTTPR